MDKHGVRRQGGPIELAYPDARRTLVDLIVKETVKAGYDGISFLTYVENYSLRFQDEFGFSDPIVADFKRLCKVDLRTDPFKRGASREDWLRLRGSYVTVFLRELKGELDKHRVKLGMVVNSNDPRLPQSWNVPELMMTAGSHHMDVDTWVRDRLVDELLVYGNNSTQSQMKTLDVLTFLARGTKTKVSVMTSGPFRESWKPYQDAGMATILAVNEDAHHIERGFVPEQTAEAMRSADVSVRMRALQQSITGNLKLDTAAVVACAHSQNMIERRLALQALGKLPDAPLELLLAGLRDPENGVRCMAAFARAQRKDPIACAPLLEAAEQHGNHMLRECFVIALRRLTPLPVAELSDAALHSKSEKIREVAMRALMVNATPAMLPTFREALKDAARFPRFAAAEALGNIAKNTEAIELLIATLDHDDHAVANRAAVSLGKLAALKNPVSEASRAKMLAALVAAFKKHADAKRDDAEWGWRPIGNAIQDFGEEGTTALRAIRDQRADARLAELAWRVVDLTQRMATFSEVSTEQNEAAMKRRPGKSGTVVPAMGSAGVSPAPASAPPTQPRGAKLGPHLHVDPAAGDDANDGRTKPVKTIARAIKLAQPGDTVHLAPVRFKECAVFANKFGEAGKPITLDGHGAVLDGADPLVVADWHMTAPGLYRHDHLLRMDPAILMRWFFVFDGKMNRMSRTSKGPSAPLKRPDELAPGEWTYVADAPITRETKDGKPWDAQRVTGAFFIKIDAAKTLADYRIEAPLRSAGVQFSGHCEHITVRDVTGTHVYNDGFNIHGDQRALVFENIAAIDCGDDGFSAHEAAECRIDGFISIGNSTGLCDTVASRTHYRNLFIRDCLGYDVFFVSHGVHSIENALIESSAARAVSVGRDGAAEGACEVRFKNVLVRRVGGGPQEFRIAAGAKLDAEHCTFESLLVQATPGSEVNFRRCVITGDPKPEVIIWKEVTWHGEGNAYDVKSLRVDRTNFSPQTFAGFQKLTGSEAGSQWNAPQPRPGNLGADAAALRKLIPQQLGK